MFSTSNYCEVGFKKTCKRLFMIVFSSSYFIWISLQVIYHEFLKSDIIKFHSQIEPVGDIFLTRNLLIVWSWQLTPPGFRDLWPRTLRYIYSVRLPWRQGHLWRGKLSPWEKVNGLRIFLLEKSREYKADVNIKFFRQSKPTLNVPCLPKIKR